MAAEYCLPAVTVYLQQYAGGAVAAAFLTGMIGGYNGSVLETSALGSADAGCFAAEKIGACIGTALQYGSPRGLIKGGVTATTNLVGKEVIHSATTVATKKAGQAWSWFSRNLVRRNAPQAAGQSLAKNVTKQYNAAKSISLLTKEEVQYTKSNLRLGQKMHQKYKVNHVIEKVAEKEFRGVPGIRPDFVDFRTNTIYELKPFNPRAMKIGMKQLCKYKTYFEKYYGDTWNTVLDTY